MKVVLIGTGYVGLVSGTCFAHWGHDVVCVDTNSEKIAALNEGRIPIYEPGLSDLVLANVAAGRLTFTTSLAHALEGADVVFIAVGTPPRVADGEADLSFVYMAAREISLALTGYAVVAVKSTVPVGTGDAVARIMATAAISHGFDVVSNPEFLREGSAIDDFLRPDRIVIGSESDRALKVMAQLYRPAGVDVPVVFTRRRTSELIKYAANAFLAAKIAFINEMADLCEQVGADVKELSLGIGLDRRVGRSFLEAGPGYGGSCFPKDTLALLRSAQDFGVSLRVVEETVSANSARKRRMALKVVGALGGSVEGLTIAVLGLSFKPETDDIRESPAIPLIESLERGGATIRAYDPVAMERAAAVFESVKLCETAYDAAQGAHAVVIVTDWAEFKTLDLKHLHDVMAGDVLVDLRNIIASAHADAAGLRLTNVGRQKRAEPPIPNSVAHPTHSAPALITVEDFK
jgi:UDPglucose 6-dehydrogenase